MSTPPTITLTGMSGASYTYWIFPNSWSGSREPGNYVFARPSQLAGWDIIYIGQTDDFHRRLSEQKREHRISQYEPTHIFAHVNNSSMARHVEEGDLIAAMNPPGNRQS